MADSYWILDTDGVFKPVEATDISAGAGDAGKIIALNAAGMLDESMNTASADTKVCPASEALSAGDLVQFWLDTATLKVRKADASGPSPKWADGYVKDAVESAANATVYMSGTNTGVTGLTVGADYWLSATAGGVVDTPPTSGDGVQYVGKTTAAGELHFINGVRAMSAA
jgi:hypothetical protein